MKKIIFLFSITAIAVACNNMAKEPSRDELSHTIDSIYSSLIASNQYENADTTQGNNIVSLFIKFADTYPTDSLTPFYLHRAAQVATGMGNIEEMIEYYNRVIDNYPDYIKLDECYYEKGIALDNAGRKDEARETYQQFLEMYPNHFLADDIRKALSLLDLSDELLIKFLNSNA